MLLILSYLIYPTPTHYTKFTIPKGGKLLGVTHKCLKTLQFRSVFRIRSLLRNVFADGSVFRICSLLCNAFADGLVFRIRSLLHNVFADGSVYLTRVAAPSPFC